MENLIVKRVKNRTLTKAQQKIADYFIKNPERVGMCSSMEVAREIGVSDASITRFARAIGYAGFSELKSEIYSNLAMRATGGVNSLSLSERFDYNQTKYGQVDSRENFMSIVQYNLQKTIQQNSEEKFDQAVSMLIRAKHRYIIGFRGCLGVAFQCAWLLRFLLDHVISISDEGGGGIGSLQDITEEDCVIFFSVKRYYKSDIRLIELARRRNARICVISDSALSPLADFADLSLWAEVNQMSFFNSALPLTMISEYLIIKTAQLQSDDYYRKVEEREEMTREMRST